MSYPYLDGDVVVIGPECFVARDGAVLCWRGENYVRQTRLVALRRQARDTIYRFALALR